MDIGLNIADGVRVRVGDTLDYVSKSLQDNNIAYTIPYSGKSGKDTNMVLYVEACGVELNLTADLITYIKCTNSKSNYIMQLESGMSPVSAIGEIKTNLASAFNVKPNEIRIDKFDGSNFNSMLSIPINNKEKVKIELVMGANQRIFMHSLSLTK